MSTELKIGAGLGIFVVATCAWFFYTRSSGNRDIPLPGEQPISMTEPVGPAEPASKARTAARRPAEPRAEPVAAPTRRPATRKDRPTVPHSKGKQAAPKPPDARPDRTPAVTPVAGRAARPATSGRSRPARLPARAGPSAPKAEPAQAKRYRPDEALLASASLTGRPLPPDAPEARRRGPVSSPAPSAATPTETGGPPALGTADRKPPEPSAARETPRTARLHVVESGESFALIAEKYYGSQKYMEFLIQANPQVQDPSRLSVGQTLRVPPGPPSTGAPSQPASRPTRTGPLQRTYVVQQGDSFYDIARRLLGDGTRWPELYELNRDEVGLDPSDLRVGQLLEIPPK